MVIGGGPGGSASAALLAQRGYRVALLERERFPRDHVGESLLPASMPVLEELGVLDDVERAGFPKKWGATMLWGEDPDPWSWRFSETNRAYPHAYQVWRPTFDKILLDNARAHGVAVREGHSVTGAIRDGDKVTGVRFRSEEGSDRAIRANWVIDASGQNAVLGRSLGLRQWDDYFRNMAVYSYFRGARRLPDPDSTNIFIESYEHGWTWCIPLANDMSGVGVVVDSERGQLGIAERGVHDYYADQLRSTARTAEMTANAEMTSPPRVIKDWSYTSSQMVGDGWILVGDAACFVDPLFSSGVHLALMSAVMAAAYVHAVAADPTMRLPAADVYQRLYRKEYGHFRELARLFYASNRTVESYFWEARRLLGDDDDEARRSFIRAVAGQAPRGYERAVLDRGRLPAALANEIRDIESGRETRTAKFEALLAQDKIPSLAEGVKVERKPIFADDAFQWSLVLLTPDRPDGTPISQLVAALISCIDGAHTTSQILNRLTAAVPPDQKPLATQALTASLQILYADAAVKF